MDAIDTDAVTRTSYSYIVTAFNNIWQSRITNAGQRCHRGEEHSVIVTMSDSVDAIADMDTPQSHN